MTQEELAKKLGVSKSTVSRALSGKGRIGKATKERIQSAVVQYGMDKYSKNKEESTGNIGVVIPEDAYTSGNPYFQDCLLGICETAMIKNYNVLVTIGMINDISSIQMLVEEKKVDGIVLMRTLEDDKSLKYLTDVHFPVGITGLCEYEDVIQVDIDNKGASESLTSYLIGQGCKKFAFIGENLFYRVNQSRYDGFCNAIEKGGLSKEDQFFYIGSLKKEFLDIIINNIIEKKVECIVCCDDGICTQIVSKLQVQGCKIPEDMRVVSLYNSANLSCFSPSITAVNVEAKGVGNIMGVQMINFLTGQKYEKKTMIDYEILFRKSTARVENE